MKSRNVLQETTLNWRITFDVSPSPPSPGPGPDGYPLGWTGTSHSSLLVSEVSRFVNMPFSVGISIAGIVGCAILITVIVMCVRSCRARSRSVMDANDMPPMSVDM